MPSLGIIAAPPASVYADAASPSPSDLLVSFNTTAFLGYGLIRPFQRDLKNDFSNAGGVDLIKSCVAQVLLTRGSVPDNPVLQGELDWNPGFGSQLYRLRHQKNVAVKQALAKVYVTDALRRWEPRVIVKSIRVAAAPGDETTMLIKLIYDVIRTNVGANQVVYPNVDQTVTYANAA